jgi:CO/xanthine dehydrogenase Mo-binding subunit
MEGARKGTKMTTTLQYVGTATKRIDSYEKLIGAELFAADLALPGMLHARLVTSPHASARILSIDATEARSLPGVVAVYSAADLEPHWRKRPAPPPLAVGRVSYYGQPVAVVVAESEAVATDAAALVRVAYEPLPALLDIEEALRPDTPRAVDETMLGGESGASHTDVTVGAAEDRTLGPNVSGHIRFQRGDIARGLAESEVVVTRTYRTRRTHQGYIEPHAMVAAPDPTGTLQVWTATQSMFACRDAVASAVGLPAHRVRLTAMAVGGGFGGKYLPVYEPLVGLLAHRLRRPVRLVLSRTEEFLAMNPAPACTIALTTGARRDGTLLALQARVTVDIGVAGHDVPTAGLCSLLGSCYRIPHLDIEGFDAHTNSVLQGSYRAPGGPQAVFALESNLSIMARELGLDEIAFRLRNIAGDGDPRPDGSIWRSIALRECLEALQQHPAYAAPLGEHEGVGIAVGAWGGSREPASAVCRLDADGTLDVILGSQDISGSNTSLALMAAEAFGMELARVRIVSPDSLAAPYGGSAGGSKITYTVGAAVVQAATEARRQLLAIAAEELESIPEDLEIAGDAVRVRGVPHRSRPIADLARLTMVFGGRYAPVYASGTIALDRASSAATAHLARVRVDPETGEVQVLRYVAAQDAGRAINPATVAGQIIGGAVQGFGWGLYEGMEYDERGTLLTATLLDYALPRANTIPPIDALILEHPAPNTPFGAKGVGEPPLVPPAAALANAIAAATGARVHELPITPERLLRALGGN